ncbi:sugar nucleotide-binding protein [Pilimelia columellifera subsp. columellifera]|uniref:Sugar nucleotide-binding protein n=2 Tax=Pilimelia TaxID=53370 RepID=A0ABN3N7P8_9ACTN
MLVTGATGYLGGHVVSRAMAAGWQVVSSARSGGERVDIRDRGAVLALLRRLRPDAVVHTAVGRERQDWATTADGAANVAVAAVGCRLAHVSSDAVFSGRDVEYAESALPDPVNRYGAAKAAAETAVRAVLPEAVIVRTSLLLGDGNGQHERLTHDLITGRLAGALYTDQIRCPAHVGDVAAALVELAAGDHHGVVNVAGPEAISRYDLGVLVARRDGLDAGALPSATLAESAEPRPADVRLRLDLASNIIRTPLRGAGEFLAV